MLRGIRDGMKWEVRKKESWGWRNERVEGDGDKRCGVLRFEVGKG